MAHDYDDVVPTPQQGGPRHSEVTLCWRCTRRMYKTPLEPNTPTEWRHGSTGRTLSYSPEKHVAATHRAQQRHGHRWEPVAGQSGVSACAVEDCDSQVYEPVRAPRINPDEARAAAGWGSSILGSRGEKAEKAKKVGAKGEKAKSG